jgi:hypothetical protein
LAFKNVNSNYRRCTEGCAFDFDDMREGVLIGISRAGAELR